MKYIVSKNEVLHLTQDSYSSGETLCGHKYDCNENWEEIDSSKTWYYQTCKNCERILDIAENYSETKSNSEEENNYLSNNQYSSSSDSFDGIKLLVGAGVFVWGVITLLLPRDKD